MDLQAGFEHDLQRWLATVYDRVELFSRHEERVAVERVIERENRLLTGLIIILGCSILLLPFVGGNAMMAALALLYVGALGSSLVTMIKIRRLEQSTARQRAIRERRESAWRGRPSLGPDERAQLIRIINLSRLTGTGSGTAALAVELSEARTTASLAAWPALQDAEILTRTIPVFYEE